MTKTWQLIRPYWVSRDRWRGRGLLAIIVALALGQVYISVRLNAWNAVFYNALQDKKLDVFLHQLGVFAVLAFCYIAAAVYQQYFNQMLHIRWRSWMTAEYQNTWLSGRAYYRLQLVYAETDNPDQRIADDIDQFTSGTLSLGIGLLSSVVTLVSFVTILWGLSGSITVPLWGAEFVIPGYMVWVALVYAALGTWLTHKIGRRLVTLNVDQQRYEANFRFSLIRLREYAEAIAFYRGEAVEGASLRARFEAIRGNWWEIMRKRKQLAWFTSAYGQIAVIFPILVAAPRYFSGAMQLGGLMQTASAFGHVQGALSWLIDVYASFAGWKAAGQRLSGFRTAIAKAKAEEVASPITLIEGDTNVVKVEDLTLSLPNGAVLQTGIALSLTPGERLLITGPSGSGKTTLLRALAGIWPYGSGRVTLPASRLINFVPQRPYLPNLTLAQVLYYPEITENYSTKFMTKSLQAVGLTEWIGQWERVEHWGQLLSLGEQQKLAFARLLAQRPEVMLLDEATASLDEAAEAMLYEALIAALPEAIIISVGHRSSLKAWHTREYRMGQ